MSSRIAFVFPGQGSQYAGMGKELVQVYPASKDIFDEADANLDKKISSLCFEGPEEALNQTVNTQLAMFVCDIAALALIKEKAEPTMVAGHSLGEYAALVAASVISFESGLKLVAERAKIMEKYAKSAKGKMAAVLGLKKEVVEEAIDSLNKDEELVVANYNSPYQQVISGTAELITQATPLLMEKGAKRVVELKVAGGFHSPLMKEAQEEFASVLQEEEFNDAQVPVVSNYTASASTSGLALKEALAKQITGSVKWQQTIELMVGVGIDTFIELGPGHVLSSLIKRQASQAVTFATEDEKSVKETLARLEEE